MIEKEGTPERRYQRRLNGETPERKGGKYLDEKCKL